MLSTVCLPKQFFHYVKCLIVETNWFYSLSCLYNERPIVKILSLDFDTFLLYFIVIQR